MEYEVITIYQLWEAMTEPEQDAMIQSRQLPMQFVAKHWNSMTRWQQKSCISHQRGLSKSFYVERWVEMTDDLQQEAIKFSRISEAYIAQCWATTKEGARTDILNTMRLSESTCERCWEYATDLQKYETKKNREDICRAQRLSMQFIEARWEEMTETQKEKCYTCQRLTPEFALQHWEELAEASRKECITICINKAPEALLPSFLTSTDDELRRVAITRMGELLATCDGGRRLEVPTMYE